MAGDWIKIEHALPDKPEVFRMADMLGIEPDAVVGKLVRFWSWCDQQSVNGESLGVSPSTIDHVTRLPGFSDALRKVDWLLARSGSLAVPHFDRHNGQTAKARGVTNRRVAGHREKTKGETSDCNGDGVTKTVTREEKRREEERERADAQSAETGSIFLQAPCTEEEAWAYAQTVAPTEGLKWIRPAVVVWWRKRDANGWRKHQSGRPVTKGNWQSDLQDSAPWAHEEARRLMKEADKQNGKDPLKAAMKPGRYDKVEPNAADAAKVLKSQKKARAKMDAETAALRNGYKPSPEEIAQAKLKTDLTPEGGLILTGGTT